MVVVLIVAEKVENCAGLVQLGSRGNEGLVAIMLAAAAQKRRRSRHTSVLVVISS